MTILRLQLIILLTDAWLGFGNAVIGDTVVFRLAFALMSAFSLTAALAILAHLESARPTEGAA